MQDVNGNLFLASELFSNSDTAAMEAKPIRSLTLNSEAQNNNDLTRDRAETNFLCFASGTRILTPEGERLVETFNEGDLVETLDHGPQPIRWIGSSTVSATGNAAPIRIRSGACGHGLPSRDLLVSRQHRMLVSSPICERMFSTREALIAAIRLVGVPGIEQLEGLKTVTYWHLLLDRNEIIFAEGAPTESFLPGPCGLAALGTSARAEISNKMSMSQIDEVSLAPARVIPTNAFQRWLTHRHFKNDKPLLSAAPLISSMKPKPDTP